MCVSTTYGSGDWGRTPHGAIIAGAAFGKLPFVMDGIELEAVGVDDAARAMILAADRGRVGERYLISEKMISNADVVRIAAEAAGVPLPPSRFRCRCRMRWPRRAASRRSCAAPTNSSRWLAAAHARRSAGRPQQGDPRIGLGTKAGGGVDSRGRSVLGGPARCQAEEQDRLVVIRNKPWRSLPVLRVPRGICRLVDVLHGSDKRVAVLIGEIGAQQEAVGTERVDGTAQCRCVAMAYGVVPQSVHGLTWRLRVSGASHGTWSSARRGIIGSAPPDASR